MVGTARRCDRSLPSPIPKTSSVRGRPEKTTACRSQAQLKSAPLHFGALFGGPILGAYLLAPPIYPNIAVFVDARNAGFNLFSI